MEDNGHSQGKPEAKPPFLTATAFVLLFGVSRLPFLWTGYGSDADAWMVAHAADRLWHTGTYSVSRFPGFPLHEIVSAPLVALGGSLLSNATTLLVALLTVLVVFRIAGRHFRNADVLVASLAFTPLVWINSAATMDYAWSLLCLSLSLQAALQKRVISTGIWVGVAAGFRLPNVVAVIPLLVLLYYSRTTPGEILKFIGSVFAVTVLAYTPVLLTYGPPGWIRLTQEEMSDIHFAVTDRFRFFLYRSVYAIGPPAVIAGLSILFINRQECVRRLRSRDPLLTSLTCGIAVFVTLFFLFPLERAYLLPAILFLLLEVSLVSSRTQLLVFGVCIASFAFLNPDVIIHQGMIGTPGLNVHWGMVVEEYGKRHHLLEERDRIPTIPVAGNAMVMTGGGAEFWFQNEHLEPDTSRQWRRLKEHVFRRRSHQSVHFVRDLQPAEVEQVRSQGYTVYCLESARPFIEKRTGASVAADQVVFLPH